jgi:hypothetical protein
MQVTLVIHGHTAEFFPEKKTRHVVSLDSPMCIREIIERLGVRPELIMGVFVEGRRMSKDFVPSDGDEVILISPAAGG